MLLESNPGIIETVTVLGQSISLYYLFWFLGMAAAFAVALLIRKEYGLSASKCIIYVSLDLSIGILLTVIMSYIFGGGKPAGMNYVRIVSCLWIYFLLLAHLLKDPYKKMLDFLTIKGNYFYAVAHIGCIFPGCCHGYPSEWGLYSNSAGYVCFPVQLVEVLINMLIGFALLKMRKKDKFQGLLNPWYMLLFGGTRFITEFFRDNNKLFWGISEMALHALLSFILGFLALIILNRRKEKEVK